MDEKQVLWIFYIVLATIILVTLFNFINTKAKGIDFKQDYYSRDIALVIDSAYSANGDLELLYKMSGEFNLIFDENKLIVKKLKGEGIGRSYYFTKNELLKTNLVNLEGTDKFVIKNKEGNFLITNE